MDSAEQTCQGLLATTADLTDESDSLLVHECRSEFIVTGRKLELW